MAANFCPGRNYDVPNIGNDPLTGVCNFPDRVIGGENDGRIYYNVGSNQCYVQGICGPASNPGGENDGGCNGKYAGPGEEWKACYYSLQHEGEACAGLPYCVNTCYKVQWNEANKLACCLGRHNDNINCDPTWCRENVDVCGEVLSEYCGDPANALQAGGELACREFCDNPANGEVCDQVMGLYCQQNPSQPYCNCLTSHIPAASCFDQRCTNTPGAYQSVAQSRQRQSCGTFCEQIVQCVEVTGTCNIDDVKFSANCSNYPPLVPPGPKPPGPNPPTPGGGGWIPNLPEWVWVVIGILLIAIVLGIILYLFHRRERRLAETS